MKRKICSIMLSVALLAQLFAIPIKANESTYYEETNPKYTEYINSLDNVSSSTESEIIPNE